MSALASNKFRIHNAEVFREALNLSTSPSRLYVFIGQSTAWANDAAPGTPVDSTSLDATAWRAMLGMKKVQLSDTTHCIPRYEWVTGTVYTEYTNITSLAGLRYYVVTEDYNVYKCLFNNNGAASTVKPTGTSTSTITTADGYKWKFMYKITAAEILKFVTANYIPVKTLTSDDSSVQWDVQSAAANGAIDVCKVTANGSNYKQTTGAFTAVSNSTILTLASTANTAQDIYVGSTLFVVSGNGAGQIRDIIDYSGATYVVTVNNAFTIVPTSGSLYHVGPKISVRGVGVGALAYANVVGGQIRNINMINAGQSYSYANVAITANTGSGATAIPLISPPGGHGSHPVRELRGHNVMFNVRLTGSESDTLTTNNDFRMVGIIRDPLLVAGTAANGTNYNTTTTITLTTVTGDFIKDETVTGGTSSSKAQVVAFANTNTARTLGTLSVTNNDGVFRVGETITGSNSSVTAFVSAVAAPAIRRYTGDVLYVENRLPTERAADQVEDIKIVIKF